MLKSVIKDSKIDPSKIEDVIVGNVLLPGAGGLLFRGACLMAGIPVESSLASVNRFCSSGLEAVSLIATKIKCGLIEIGIGAGCESMSMNEMSDSINPDLLSEDFIENE